MRVAPAWIEPLDQLSCGACRVLVGQRFGPNRLSALTANVVARSPRAVCDLYPGDLAVTAPIAGEGIPKSHHAMPQQCSRRPFPGRQARARDGSTTGSCGRLERARPRDDDGRLRRRRRLVPPNDGARAHADRPHTPLEPRSSPSRHCRPSPAPAPRGWCRYRLRRCPANAARGGGAAPAARRCGRSRHARRGGRPDR